ncbi:orotidine-5'-phosphate decarboxylase [Dacryopinax primogenitus]|uniref:Orotidine 5'-phosphate decarboxylase n=1 Tax=Dacryopinax primogenitus (strain DJM 731) TaxID=1858805 RepID=M5GBC2_DACPD|nr:orotidine-5'-phosphate decarboxylase [Dacryopinax primogenitus]EJU06239.1 orotidine-5'-phosphate decarboxylase [Dacryopinax primogenitus]
MSPQVQTQTYDVRLSNHTNPAARALLECILRKRSNLCVSVDLSTSAELLEVVDAVGPSVCLIKTHMDIVEDFDQSVIDRLRVLSEKHDFLIFEDRKFADIGNTVVLQYSKGVHKIASWAQLTNAHVVPGSGIITGLASVGLPLGRGLLLLAEMSSAGTLAQGAYTDAALAMAREHRDFVVGFIAQRRLGDEDWLILTPGVQLGSGGDSMGQQYNTPREVVRRGADVIIVGRGVYGKRGEAGKEAERYRKEGWEAYLARVGGGTSRLL